MKSEYFLERREIGIINVGGDGVVMADGKEFSLGKLDCVYLGKGTKEVNSEAGAKNILQHFFYSPHLHIINIQTG